MWLFFCLLIVLFLGSGRIPRWLELLLPIAMGLIFGLLGTFWLAPFHLQDSIVQSDFLEYCTGVAAPDPLSTGVSAKRSALPMLLPRSLYNDFGIFDALALGSLISMSLTGSMLYLWGRSLLSPLAGIACVFCALTLGPMTLMGRHLTSYPEMTLCFVLAATTTTFAIVKPSTKSFILGGIGLGIVLLSDARGIIWALPMGGGMLLAIFQAKTFGQGALWIGALLIPTTYSWFLGSEFYVPEAIGLESQVDFRPMLHRFLGPESGFQKSYSYDTRWVWGLESPLILPKTLSFLIEQSQIPVPDTLEIRPEVKLGRILAGKYINLVILASGFLIITLGRWKYRWQLWALFCTALPFGVGLMGNLSLLENHSRFYFQTLSILAVVLGLCWGVIGLKRNNRGSTALAGQVLIMLSLVLGIIPSYFAPNAGWQMRWRNSDASLELWINAYHNKEMDSDPDLRHCRRAFHRLELDNLPLAPQIYD
ncbi:MAG: hypothetical protein CMK59_02990 [Proteobacteria bacterium]|nr:hypothetical protein [Pseudomonadota bacterium]